MRIPSVLALLAALLAPAVILAAVDFSGQNRTGYDFSGQDLSGATFTATNLTNANLSNANLTGATLSNARLEGANLSGATLTGTILTGARFAGTTTWPGGFNALNKGMLGPGVDLSGVTLAPTAGSLRHFVSAFDANLSGSTLDQNDFTGSDFSGANFTGTSLRSAVLRQVDFRRTNLTNANLTGANLEGANLYWANLAGTTLSQTRFSAATVWPEGFNPLNRGMFGPGVDLAGTTLPAGGTQTNLSLAGANLAGVNWAGNTFSGSNFTAANLSGANLSGANLSNADLRGANLGGANLTGANLSGALLAGALFNGNTQWPAGFDPAAAGALTITAALAQGLVAHYGFNGSGAEASAPNLALSGSGNFAFVPDRQGRSNRAVQLIDSTTAASAYLFNGTGPALAGSSSSVAFWVRKDRSGPGNWVFGLGTAGDGLAMAVCLDYNSGIRYSFWNNDFDLPDPLPTATWQQVVATFDAASRMRKVYVNGILRGTNVAAYGFSGGTALKVGYAGITLDDLRFYDRVLSGVEVEALHGLVEDLPLTQTISFAALPDRNFGEAPFALTATASSGLPVTFSVVSGPATLAGSTLTLTGAGTVVIRAAQAGDNAYSPAPTVDRNFVVRLAPVITAQPQSQTVAAGGAVSLSVTATSATAPTYQWRKGGVPIAGATGSTLALASAQPADAGYYDVILTAGTDSSTSNPALLRVTGAAAPSTGLIHHVPLSGGLGTALGSSGVLHVTVPAGQLGVNDDRNHLSAGVFGPNRFGAAGRALVFDEVAKSYARLPTPVDIEVADSFTVSLWALAEGERPTDFFGGNVLLMPTHGEWIYGSARAGVGLLMSRSEVGLTGHAHNYPAVFLSRPVQPGIWHHVVVAASGRVLRLYVDGVLAGVSDQSTSYYRLHPSGGYPYINQQAGGIGGMIGHGGDSVNGITYRGFKGRVSDFRIYNRGLDATEVQQLFAAEFSAEGPYLPTLTSHPQASTANLGSSVTFTVAATDPTNLTYQWRKDGVAITGATAATLTLPGVQSSDEGTYTAVVSNAAGSVTSQGATLTVTGVPPPPPPPSQQSQTISFAALAARTFGSAPNAVAASSSSGLPVALAVISGPGSLGDSNLTPGGTLVYTLTLTGAGTVVLRASQSGDATYAAAAPVEQSLTVNPAPATVAFGNLSAAFDGSPKPVTVTTVPAGLSVALAYGVAPGSPTAPSAVGSYPVTATVTDPNYTGTASGTLVIAGSLPVVTWTPPAGVPVGTVLGAAQLNATASVPGTFVYAPAAGTLLGTAGVQTLSLTFTPADPTYATVVTTRSVTVSTALPVLTEQPRSQAIAAGGTLTLRVGVANSAGLTYRWSRDGIALTAGTRLTGLASATLTLTDFQSGYVGAYTVEVTGGGATAVSSAAQVSLLPAGYAATHSVPGSVYAAGSTVTVTSTLTFPGQPGLGWSVLLPPGWSYAGGGGTEGDVRPTLGATDLLEWAWTSLPTSPVTFTYTLNVPAGFFGLTELVALAIFRPSGSGALQVLARPDPLVLAQFLHHSADTDCNFRLSLLELTRVIELYNTRNGSSRTGAYAVATATSEDGFTPDASRTPTATVSLARHHSADTNRDGRLSLLELTRVIELYNHRSGSARTGDYRVSPGSEDGFAPGP